MFKDRKILTRLLVSVVLGSVLLFVIAVTAGASMTPATLSATLKPGESVTETKTVDVPSMPPRADVVFSFDLTGSMSGTIATAKARAIDIMTALNATGVDINYGVASYMDYPNSYSSYGYSSSYGSAWCGDYAYKLGQGITSDTTAVSNAINGLVQGCGDDGPQDYTRIMYESYADSNIGWRDGAKKILINFGDNVPHDNNLDEGVSPSTNWSTGGDPGRDEIMFTADDLDLQTVLAGMAANHVTLLEAHTADWPASWEGGSSGKMILEYWNYWTAQTGGTTFLTGSGTLVTDVVNQVTSALTSPTINNLHLAASSGYESWLASVTPASYSGPTGVTLTFQPTIQVPLGTTPGTYNFTISAIDNGGVSYGDQLVTIEVLSPNSPPVISAASGSVYADEGATAANTGSVSDPDGDTVTLTASAGTVVNNGDGTWSWSMAVIDGPADSQTVTITADDGKGGTATTSFALTVNNVAPVVGAISAQSDVVPCKHEDDSDDDHEDHDSDRNHNCDESSTPGSVVTIAPGVVRVGVTINTSANFTDPGVLDTHTAVWDWGDGSTSIGTVSETGGSGSVTGSHVYAAAGFYNVKVTVTDKDGGAGESVYQNVVVYDRDSEVTGGGWYKAGTSKANFGFEAEYEDCATVPKGELEFRYKPGNINLHSTGFDWLVVSGPKAVFKGSGKINGTGGYGFLVSFIDGRKPGGGGVDKIRIKIWNSATGVVVYDTQPGAPDTADPTTALGGGRVTIHSS